jgi:hypothetical protein
VKDPLFSDEVMTQKTRRLFDAVCFGGVGLGWGGGFVSGIAGALLDRT